MVTFFEDFAAVRRTVGAAEHVALNRVHIERCAVKLKVNIELVHPEHRLRLAGVRVDGDLLDQHKFLRVFVYGVGPMLHASRAELYGSERDAPVIKIDDASGAEFFAGKCVGMEEDENSGSDAQAAPAGLMAAL